jgi:hypothetical protein
MELKIKKETAKKLYPESPEWFKEILSESFGKDCFTKRKYSDIKTFEDACEELGISTEQFLAADTSDEIAYKKLKIIVRAINQDWIPDWNNSDQYKWFPYFNLSSGFGFSGSGYGCDITRAGVGSRLCFESEAKSNHAGRQFTQLFQDFITGK